MKKLITLFTFLFTFSASAGFMDSNYSEAIAGCAVAGGVGYATSSNSSDAMKNAAIYCVAVGSVMALLNYHFETKFGKEYDAREAHQDKKLLRYKMLKHQNFDKKEDDFFRKEKEIIKPMIDGSGQGIGPRIKERLILNDDGIDFGT